MATGIYTQDFSKAFSELIAKVNVSCYQINQFTGIDQGYLSRLRSGAKGNPSVETLLKISFAIVHSSEKVMIQDIEELFNSTGRSLCLSS